MLIPNRKHIHNPLVGVTQLDVGRGADAPDAGNQYGVAHQDGAAVWWNPAKNLGTAPRRR